MVLLSAVVALCGVVLCSSSAENGTAAHSVTIETVVAAAALPQGVGARHDGGHEAPHDAPTDAHATLGVESATEFSCDPPVDDDDGANESAAPTGALPVGGRSEGDDLNTQRPARRVIADVATGPTSAPASSRSTEQPPLQQPDGDECPSSVEASRLEDTDDADDRSSKKQPREDTCAGAEEELRLCLSSCDEKADRARRETTLSLEGAFNETIARVGASCDERVERARNETARRLEAEFEEEHNSTLAKVQRLRNELKRKEGAYKSLEERHHSSRMELSETRDDLRRMHERAVSKWVNLTLVGEDAWDYAARKSSKIARPWLRRWERFHRSVVRPAITDTRRKTAAARRDFERFARPRIARLMNRAERWWAQSSVRRPVELASKRGRALLLRVYESPVVEEARVAVRLSAVSAIEEASKMGLSAIDSSLEARREKSRRQKEREQIKRGNGTHRSAIQRPGKHATRPKVNGDDGIDVDVRPTSLQLKFKRRFDYAIAHSDQVYDAFVSLLPLLLVLFWAKAEIVGTLLLLLGFPRKVVWAYALYRHRRMKKRSDSPA